MQTFAAASLILAFAAGLLGAAEPGQPGKPIALAALEPSERAARMQDDLQAVARYRAGLLATIAAAEARPDLFPMEKPAERHVLTAQARRDLSSLWQSHLDYLFALDSVGHYYRDYWKLKNPAEREDAFLITYAAFLAQMRGATDFIALAEIDPTLEVVLNEPTPDAGLPAKQYARVKFRFLNVACETEAGALWTVAQFVRGTRQPQLRAEIQEDSDVLQRAGFKRTFLTLANGVKILQAGAFAAWFPLQTGVAEWMGDTRVRRNGSSLVSQEQIAAMIGRLEPADVMLERREWFLSNVGLPGYWPHAAIYIGTADERAKYFADAAVADWVRAQGRLDGDFEALLRSHAPKAYLDSGTADALGHSPRVLEAMSEGVVFTSLEHSAATDAIALLRPRLSKVEKARAILRAFGYAGLPYDFNFDFQTDSAIVCSELVVKSFDPSEGYRGLKLPVVQVLGRPTTAANEIARQFDAQCGTPAQQFDLLLFLDGYEKEGRAVEASLDVFRSSWKRPKWHILIQGAAEGG